MRCTKLAQFLSALLKKSVILTLKRKHLTFATTLTLMLALLASLA